MDKEKCHFFARQNKIVNRYKEICYKNHHSEKELGYRIIKGGYVLISRKWAEHFLLEGGIVDSSMCYIPESGYIDNGGCSYEFDSSNVESGGKCLFLGTFHTVYGHAITDALKRLWFLHTELGNSLVNDPSVDLVYITSCNVDMPQWHIKILELAGVDVSRIKQIRSITKYDEIIIPDNSLFKENGVLCYSDEYRETIETIKNNVRNTTCYKTAPSLDLYFTRTAINDPSKREIGEKSIEKLFKKRGFQVFSPEKLSLEKQISLLMKCKRFAATEGSCSHASVFCNPSAEVIILRKANYVNSYSAMINDFIGYQTVFVDVNHSVMTNKEAPMVGPFYLYVSKELSRFMDINYIHRPLFSRPSYLNYYLTNSIKKHHHLTKILLVLKNRFRGQKWAHSIKGRGQYGQRPRQGRRLC